jgi:hypothetical protein
VYRLARDIQWIAGQLGDGATAAAFGAAAEARAAAIAAVLWDGAAGCWRDGVLGGGSDAHGGAYVGSAGGSRDEPGGSSGGGPGAEGGGGDGGGGGEPRAVTPSPGVFASNFVPLWAGLVAGDEDAGARIVAALEASGLVHPAGEAPGRPPRRQQAGPSARAVPWLPGLSSHRLNRHLPSPTACARRVHVAVGHGPAVGPPQRLAAAAAHAHRGRARARRAARPRVCVAPRARVGQVRAAALLPSTAPPHPPPPTRLPPLAPGISSSLHSSSHAVLLAPPPPIRSNLAAWKATGHMHEKYDVRGAGGAAGGGGEYRPQVGFGWSNGVLLEFLGTYYP